MDFDNSLPIYIQIMDLIKRRIVLNELGAGEKLPSVRDIAQELKVNPNTIQRSYSELEREEIVYTQRGLGTFITEDTKRIRDLKSNLGTRIVEKFITDMNSLGYGRDEIIELISNMNGGTEWIQ